MVLIGVGDRVCLASASAGRTLYVDSKASGNLGDGSRGSPWSTIGAALLNVHDGDTIFLAPGSYAEPLRVERSITIRGSAGVVVDADQLAGAVFDLQAPVRLQGFRIQGGEVGVLVKHHATLEDMAFCAQRKAAVQLEGEGLEVSGSSFTALFDQAQLKGIDSRGGQLVVRGSTFDGPFRFAIRQLGGELSVEKSQIEGAVVGVACLQNCSGLVANSQLSRGSGTAILAAASRLIARENLISDWQECVTAGIDANLTLVENIASLCKLVGVSATHATLTMTRHVHLGPSQIAAIMLVDSQSAISEGLIDHPGAMGMSIRHSHTQVDGTIIRGAYVDTDGDFGDGIYAFEADLRLNFVTLENNDGAGLTVAGGRAWALGVTVSGNGLAGMVVEKGASLRLEGSRVVDNRDAGLVVIEKSQVDIRFGQLERNPGGAIGGQCHDGSSIELRFTRVDHADVLKRQFPCIRRR